MMIAFEVRHHRGGFHLDVGAERGPGVLGVFGPSGSGKTTLLHCLAGFLRPREGRVILGGRTVFDSAAGISLPPEQRRAGMVFQEAMLFPHLSVKDNLFYGCPPRPDKQAAHNVLATLELYRFMGRRPDGLSGGERQRVALGRALLAQPQVLLLDEPLSALDGGARRQILLYLKRIRDHFALPMIYVSHAVSELLFLADRVMVLDQGRTAGQGAPAETLLTRDEGTDAIENIYDVPVRALLRETGMAVVDFGGVPLKVSYRSGAVRPRLRVGIRASDIMVGLSAPTGISARNILPATVEKIYTAGARSRVALRTQGQACLAELSPEAVMELALTPGKSVFLIIKARSAVVFD